MAINNRVVNSLEERRIMSKSIDLESRLRRSLRWEEKWAVQEEVFIIFNTCLA